MASIDHLNLTEEEKAFLGMGVMGSVQSLRRRTPSIVDLTEEGDDPMPCDVCQVDLTKLDFTQRQLHYETHFSDPPDAPRASTSRLSAHTSFSTNQNAFWWPSCSMSFLPNNYAPGLIPFLKRALVNSHQSGYSMKAALCREDACHIKSELFDLGWGCGYRNFLMACTSLMTQKTQPRYTSLLQPGGELPGVRRLQQWLENAWRAGYDPPGADHFKHSILGSRKWVGTGDLYVVFSYLGIPAQLVDFRKSDKAPTALSEWIAEYFSPPSSSSRAGSAFEALMSSPVIVTEKMPVILQHAGHSRMVVGYERDSNGAVNLLVFDPAKTIPAHVRDEAVAQVAGEASPSPKREPPSISNMFRKRGLDEDDWSERGIKRSKTEGEASKRAQNKWTKNATPEASLKLFRINLKSLSRKKEYQILYFPLDNPLSEYEKQRRKVVMSDVGC